MDTSIKFSPMGQRLTEPVITDLMARALADPAMLSLAAGFTDNTQLPKSLVGQAVAGLTAPESDPETLQYGTNAGRTGLREAVCRIVSRHEGEDASRITPEQVFLAQGSQQALYLSMQVLCEPGDIILVEEPTYFVFMEMLQGLGLEARSIPYSPDTGIDFGKLEQLFLEMQSTGEWARVRAVYIEGYFSNPSSRSQPASAKSGLANFLRERNAILPIIEDAAYRDLYFEKPWSAMSTLSMPEFDGFPVLYLGTFDKPFASGLKSGFGICNHQEWRNNMLFAKGHQDFGSSNFVQALIERVVSTDAYDAHVATVRAHYKGKAFQVQAILEAEGLADVGWQWEPPSGGLYFWLKGPEGFDTSIGSDFCEACLANKVLYVPGDLCLAGGQPRNCVRLSYGVLLGAKLDEAVRRFVRTATAG
ncbi:MAG: PLP-dependent aminotransferase family protein [Opitutae bacterium]|nr:PLP-dependent aminotransferase family protein [Opitutae bacterium]